MKLGIAIRQIRMKMGITQSELALLANITQTSLSMIERGNKHPSEKTLKKICGILDVPEYLLYVLAMDFTDIPPSKREAYRMLFPSIRTLAMQILKDDEPALLEEVA